MKKTLLASAALALTLGMSGSVFAGPGNVPGGEPWVDRSQLNLIVSLVKPVWKFCD